VNKAMQRYVEAASGLTNLTTAKAEQIAKQLVKSGEAASDQMGDIVEELLERQKKNREAMAALVKSETTRAVRAMGLATSTEVERLQKQVADLKRELSRVERERAKTAKSSSAKKSTGKKAAKKSTKKSTGKKAAKKSTGKKSATKKATSKKSTSKKSAKKSAAKKSTGS
jgi:polyhydroxyalkanoate synthesis regulator phasin